MIAKFTLFLAPDRAPTAEFVEARAAVACRGFSGETRFAIAQRDLAAFAADLVAVEAADLESATLIGGWDDAEERLRLRIAPAGRSGQFSGRIKIATTGPRTDQWQRVETEFVCPPGGLAGFLGDLKRLLQTDAQGAAELVGDPDAIA